MYLNLGYFNWEHDYKSGVLGLGVLHFKHKPKRAAVIKSQYKTRGRSTWARINNQQERMTCSMDWIPGRLTGNHGSTMF